MAVIELWIRFEDEDAGFDLGGEDAIDIDQDRLYSDPAYRTLVGDYIQRAVSYLATEVSAIKPPVRREF